MKKVAALLALALVSAALVACGDDDNNESAGAATGEGGGPSTLQIEVDRSGGLAYTTGLVSAKAGDLTVDFNNPQPGGHDVRFEDPGGDDIGGTDVIAERGETIALEGLKPGKYAYYCSVSGHREAGMEGTLLVE